VPGPDASTIIVVVESASGESLSTEHLAMLERELSCALRSAPVRVRNHDAAGEERPLFRLLSTTFNRISGEVALSS
jgi:hypothetical protein